MEEVGLIEANHTMSPVMEEELMDEDRYEGDEEEVEEIEQAMKAYEEESIVQKTKTQRMKTMDLLLITSCQSSYV